MSARQIRKLEELQKQKEEQERLIAEQHLGSEDNDEEDDTVKPKANLFDLLGGSDDDDVEDSDNDSEENNNDEAVAFEDKEEEISNTASDGSQATVPKSLKAENADKLSTKSDSDDGDVFHDASEPAATPLKSGRNRKKNQKKKNQKKNKKKEKAAASAGNSTEVSIENTPEVSTPQPNQTPTQQQTLTKTTKIVVPEQYIDPGFSNFTAQDFKDTLPLLQFNTRNLDPDNEYKELFGHISSKVLNDADSTTSSFTSPEVLAQIKQVAQRVRNWGGKDRRSMPGTTRKLTLTKIRDDWIPTNVKNITMSELSHREVKELKQTKNSNDWIDVIEDETKQEYNAGIRYFRFTSNRNETALNAHFLLSVSIRPNHETLIHLLQANPYHVESILQVSNILVRQGDKSNNNGLIERALFVFDRALKANFQLGTALNRLPFEYFLNRQFYLAIFKYINVLTQKGTFFTAFNYCKLLLSINPTEDPYGVRYFFDFYAVMAQEYQYLIDFTQSALCQSYINWITPGLMYSVVLSYLHLNKPAEAAKALADAFNMYPYLGLHLLEDVCKTQLGSLNLNTKFVNHIYKNLSSNVELLSQTYSVRAKLMWKDINHIKFLNAELIKILNTANVADLQCDKIGEEIASNLLRYAILSNENSLMSKIPKEFWTDNEIFEYDVLPPNNPNAELFSSMVDDNVIGQAILEESQIDYLEQLTQEQLNFDEGQG